ncbi:MAG: MFS transporter [Microbacteriaceae bacterium]
MSSGGYLATSIPLRLASAGSNVALPIAAVTQLGDVALGGALVAASLGPSVLAAPLAGVALDRARHPRRLVLLAGLVTVAAFALASGLGSVPIPLIFLALIAAGAASPFFMGGLSSFVSEEIPDERRAYALDALSYNIGAVAGPGVVALAVAAGSPRIALVVMAGSALLGALGTLALRFTARAVEPARVLGAIAAGFRHLARHRPLTVITASGTLSQFGAGALPIAAIALALERAGDAGQGAWIVTAFAIGGLIGALVSASRRWTRLAPETIMATGFAATGLLTLLAVVDLGMPWTVVVIGASGLFTAASAAAMLLLRKQQSPPEVRSQVFTVGSGLRASAAAAGAALAGVIAGLDAGVLVAGIGIIWTASALLMVAYPRGTRPLPDAA